MKNLKHKLRNESFVKKLEDSGVKVDSLKKDLKKKNKEIIEK